jgi:hypothetical protein
MCVRVDGAYMTSAGMAAPPDRVASSLSVTTPRVKGVTPLRT